MGLAFTQQLPLAIPRTPLGESGGDGLSAAPQSHNPPAVFIGGVILVAIETLSRVVNTEGVNACVHEVL